MINWGQWQSLLAVAHAGTYAKAAQTMKINATTVARRVSLLEKHIGFNLFSRIDGSLYPTAQCEILLNHLEAASADLRAAENSLSKSDEGNIRQKLRLTAPPFLNKVLFAPALGSLSEKERVRIELMKTASNISLTRREIDISIRIYDEIEEQKSELEYIDSEYIGTISYAIYCQKEFDTDDLPWAGLVEGNTRTTGRQLMTELAASNGIQYRAQSFETIAEMTSTLKCRALLPCIIGDSDSRLKCISQTVLQQPLWMLSHQQDRGLRHFETTKDWIRKLAEKKMPFS